KKEPRRIRAKTRGATPAPAGPRIVRFHHRQQLRPRHHRVHLGQKQLTTGPPLLVGVLQIGKTPLTQHSSAPALPDPENLTNPAAMANKSAVPWGAAHFVALRLQRLRQPAHAPAGPPQRRFRIPAGRWFDQRLEIREQGRVPRLRGGRLLQIAGLRPAPGRRTRSDGSSCANSFRPRPIVLGAMPVAIATAAMPPFPTANASAAATRRRPGSSRNGATVKNRSRMGSTSITTTIWY